MWQQSSVCVGCVQGAASTPCRDSGCANRSFDGDKTRDKVAKKQGLSPTVHKLLKNQMHKAKYGNILLIADSCSETMDTKKPVCKSRPTQTKKTNTSNLA